MKNYEKSFGPRLLPLINSD